MCSYCTNINTGDDYEPIIASKIDFGFFGNVYADVYLAAHVTKNGKRYPYMYLGISGNNGSGSYEHGVQINFCPMCGRELEAYEP